MLTLSSQPNNPRLYFPDRISKLICFRRRGREDVHVDVGSAFAYNLNIITA